MNCKELNIDNCFYCQNKHFHTECWINYYYNRLKFSMSKEETIYFINERFISELEYRSKRIFYLGKTIELYFPQYQQLFDTIKLM
jgi:hypothetical protein